MPVIRKVLEIGWLKSFFSVFFTHSLAPRGEILLRLTSDDFTHQLGTLSGVNGLNRVYQILFLKELMVDVGFYH